MAKKVRESQFKPSGLKGEKLLQGSTITDFSIRIQQNYEVNISN